MAAPWQSLFTSSTRRRSTIVIILSALVPFTFCFFWLLSISHPQILGEHDHDDILQNIERHYVGTPLGIYVGKVNERYHNVHEFLSVPYAQSTEGNNRFKPPVPFPKSDETFDATFLALACPQFLSPARTVWEEQVPWYRIPHDPVSRTGEGRTAEGTSEDCLKLAIWKPANATEESKLPVAMFWPGGGFQTNGIPVPAHQAAQWVSRSQSHIVVTINYRLSILGFPDAAGLQEQNLGLLDQRAALEWVRDNIANFGGDASRILLWGFSAGAQSVDFHNYAYYEDPIAHAHFAQSGSVLAFGSGHNSDHSKFTFVAKKVGCDHPSDAAKELECMQGLEYKKIIDFIGRHSGEPRLRFGPVTDEKTVFSNYEDRYKSGKVTKAPMIYSSCSNDGSTLSGYDADHPQHGPSQGSVNGVTQRIMCGAHDSSKLRFENDLVTYRYQYAGAWPNQNPLDWMGAYHSSDLVMFFGTHENGAGPLSTSLEKETSKLMQDYLLAFIKDPHNGPAEIGWPAFNATAKDGGTMLRFGADGKAVQDPTVNRVEGVCFGQGTYDPFP